MLPDGVCERMTDQGRCDLPATVEVDGDHYCAGHAEDYAAED